MLTDYLPANVRKFIYSALLTVNAVLGALVVAGYEPVPERVLMAFVGISSALGFTLARVNTSDPIA
jgi:hypothetical protein